MSDPRWIQAGFEPCLAHVIEEAGEVQAAAGKTLRWGPLSVNPTLPLHQQETNLVWLRREMQDLRSAMDRLDAEIAKEWS